MDDLGDTASHEPCRGVATLSKDSVEFPEGIEELVMTGNASGCQFRMENASTTRRYSTGLFGICAAGRCVTGSVQVPELAGASTKVKADTSMHNGRSAAHRM